MSAVVGCHVVTVDDGGAEHRDGHVAWDAAGYLTAVGGGPAPVAADATARVDGPIDGRGLLVTPGLVNAHHHLYQWITRGRATDATLFEWLTTLYPLWARLTPPLLHAAASANLGWLALTGCTTSMDHHYVFPHGSGDLLAAEIEAAARIGLRFHPTRGSMNLGASDGGLPPDHVVEPHDRILAETQAAIDRWHDPSPDAMVVVAVAPCSPFSVTPELMRDCAGLARASGVRLHTHLAETREEDAFCRERFGRTPVQYAQDLGWLGEDVWFAHGVHLSAADAALLGATGTGVAHCPTSNGRLGAGVAPVRQLLDAGVPVGLGVDGAASNESGRMVAELHQALLVARGAGGPLALTAREALRLATRGGARLLGREGELGSIEVGKLADLAFWRLDDLAGAGVDDPVGALVLGAPRLAHLVVGGRFVVRDGVLLTADAADLAHDAAHAARALAEAPPSW